MISHSVVIPKHLIITSFFAEFCVLRIGSYSEQGFIKITDQMYQKLCFHFETSHKDVSVTERNYRLLEQIHLGSSCISMIITSVRSRSRHAQKRRNNKSLPIHP